MEFFKEWQTTCTDVKARCKQLLINGQWTDCTFFVGPKSEQTIIKGHKLILAIASPVFEAMFYGSMAEKNEINIDDVKPDAFNALLQ